VTVDGIGAVMFDVIVNIDIVIISDIADVIILIFITNIIVNIIINNIVHSNKHANIFTQHTRPVIVPSKCQFTSTELCPDTAMYLRHKHFSDR